MNTKSHRLLLALIASASVACATANDDPQPEPVQPTAEIGPLDTAVADTTSADTAADTAVVDAMAEADICVYPATETKPCGKCGTTSRFCLPGGFWTGFTACTGELLEAECTVGQKRITDCGNCGKSTDFCDTKTCTFTAGFCAGEGPCAEGEEETTKASCPSTGELRKRTCDSKCQWSEYSECDLPRGWLTMAKEPSALLGRAYHSAVWTGTDMLIWGGGTSSTLRNDGASYNLSKNTWKMMAATSLSGRRLHATGWTGSKMIVWGGFNGSSVVSYKDGAIYDPATDSWAPMATPTLTARFNSAHAWAPTTKQLLVWGGCTSGDDGTYEITCTAVAGDGAMYDPLTNTWTAMPAAPIVARTLASYAWVGDELVIWGGLNASGVRLTDGARFNPVAKTWTKFSAAPTTVLDGRFDTSFGNDGRGGMYVWGGRTVEDYGVDADGRSNGAIYTPGVGWVAIPAIPDGLFAPSTKRWDVGSAVVNGKIYFFDGIVQTGSDVGAAGFVSYDLTTHVWENVDMTGAPSPHTRGSVSAVSTGREILFFGGMNGHVSGSVYTNGGIYRP